MLTFSTSAGHPGRANEDFVGAVPDAVVLVDGAGIRGAEALCHHGTAWYAASLGTTLLARLATGDAALPDVLAAAIDEVTDRHRATCEVTDPSSPCATVAIVRHGEGRVDHLVLGDSVVLLDLVDGVVVVEDRREPEIARPLREALAALAPGTSAYDEARAAAVTEFRARRNQPDGFWVAKDDGRAAEHALTGSRPADGTRGAVLLSNGASRVVDRFGLLAWDQMVRHDPAEVIRMVRAAEQANNVAADDATAACWHW